MPIEQLIYTDLARGKGLDPKLKGYQVKACSSGLSEAEREWIGSLALHFRASVYENAPRAAQDQEQAWRTTTEDLDEMPESVLKEFPHVWSYARLEPERFALTRIRYSGFTHDQRPGNFFAHSMVFPPESLANHQWNPLALSRTSLFRNSDPGDGTSLCTLSDLGGATRRPDLRLLRTEPIAAHLASILHSVGSAEASRKRVLICLDEWRKAEPLVEALWWLLPPAVRCRTTFCTLEHDRNWSGPQSGAKPASAHELSILYCREGRSFDLSLSDYETKFTVFNFVENKFTPPVQPCAYARFAAQCAESDAGLDRLSEHHRLLDKFDCGLDRSAWDAAVAVVGLSGMSPSGLTGALSAFSGLAKSEAQARLALDLLAPALQALSSDPARLRESVSGIAPLVDRAPEDSAGLAQFRAAAEKAFGEGRGVAAAAFLQACGRRRNAVLVRLLTLPIQNVSTVLEDRAAMTDLLLDGLRAHPTDRAVLLKLLEAAASAERFSETWKIAGESAVKSTLSSDLAAAERIQFLRDLIERIPAAVDSDTSISLHLELLGATKPKGDALIAGLEALVGASTKCTNPDAAADKVVDFLEDFDGDRRTEAFGRLAETARQTPLADRLYQGYAKSLRDLGGKPRFEVRRRLAARGALHVVSRDFFNDMLTEDQERLPERLVAWRDKILDNSDKLLDEIRFQTAERLRANEHVFSLAENLLAGSRNGGRGLEALCEAFIQLLPLDQPQSRTKLPLPPEKMSEAARARLQTMEFVRKLRQMSGEDDWSLDKFSQAGPPWKEARSLSPGDRRVLGEICVETVADTGITGPAHARAFLGLLDLAGVQTPDAVADAVDGLMKGRDDVTKVQVAAAFAQHALDGDKSAKWTEIFGAIARKLDREAKRLLEQHLERRFHGPDPRYSDHLEGLLAAAGLSKPKPPATNPPRADERKPASAGTGFMDKMGGAWRSLRKSPGESGSGRDPEKK